MYVAKTKTLISFAVTAKLICVFVFAYAKRRFSHDAAQMDLGPVVHSIFSLTRLRGQLTTTCKEMMTL